jgi:dTDP-4-amino-4,6-dideoxygalactose transaminase
MGESFGASLADCPVAEDVSARLLRLPFFTGLTEDDLARILEAVASYQSI